MLSACNSASLRHISHLLVFGIITLARIAVSGCDVGQQLRCPSVFSHRRGDRVPSSISELRGPVQALVVSYLRQHVSDQMKLVFYFDAILIGDLLAL